MEPTLKKLRVVITFTTTTDTSAIHGEYTDLREAVAYLRKLADAIEIELQREPRSTFNPSSSPDISLTHVTLSARPIRSLCPLLLFLIRMKTISFSFVE